MPISLKLKFQHQAALEDFLARHPQIEDGIVACQPTGSGQPPPDPGTSPPNQPPTARLFVLAGVTDQDTWVFSTEGSTDPEGAIGESRIRWGDGTADTVFSGALPDLEVSHNFPTNGSFTVSLTITDSGGLSQEAVVVVTVIVAPGPPEPDPDPIPENLSPVAALAVTAGQFSGEPFTFSTLGSFDPDNNAASWNLTYGDGTAPASGAGLPPESLTHTYALAGTYTAILTITDTGGKTGSATLTIVVQAPPPPTANQPPTAGISLLSGLYAGERFRFSITGGDADGAIASATFDPGDGSAPVAIGSLPTQIEHLYTLAGSYQARITVVDNGTPALSATASTPVTVRTPPAAGDHAYFNTMAARSDCQISRSLRSADQLLTGGGDSTAPWVTYDASTDAAKLIIEPFMRDATSTLAAGIDASTTTLTFSTSFIIQNQRPYKIDNEVVIANRVSPGVFEFLRGQYGTSPASHASGASVYRGCSSLLAHVVVPVHTQVGHTYFFGWEINHTAELQEKSYKTWQHALAPDELIWYEVNNNKPALNNALGARVYGAAGPNMTDQNPVAPQTGTFTIAADRWTRIWTYVDQRPAIPLISLWAGDAVQGIVQCFSLRQVNYTGDRTSIGEWVLEYNTSLTASDALLRTLAGWNRNLFVLRDLEEAAVPLSITGLVP